MGARHNRKRTRSRPRNRTPTSKTHSFSNSSASTGFSSASVFPIQRKPSHWEQQYNQWQDRVREQTQNKVIQQQHEAAAAEAQRLRIFGGEVGDEVSLCPSMLHVVMDLFDGRLDYEDP